MKYNLDTINQVASNTINAASEYRCWLFYGNLGAGKTTLIKSICKELGVDENHLSSPTFSIINEYASHSGIIYHADFYRIKNETELFDIGMDEYLSSGNYCFIEWPDRLGSLLPDKYFRVIISETGPFTRTIEYQKHG